MDITYDHYSLIINGRRTFIRSGAMHYFRLPGESLWRDRLFKLKAAGYNAVDLYFCWGYHSPEEGVYDFTGIRDVRKLLQITQDLGLYVIARPGPYINAETSGGGFPGWLLAKRHLPLRNRREGAFEWSDEYMGAVRDWWTHIIPLINEAPNVLLVQIENEYATLEVEPDYMQVLYDLTRELGVKAPLFHNDLYVAGLYEDIVDLYAFDNYSVTQFETDWRQMPEIFQVLDNVETNLRPFCENRPLMAAELQAGWFGTWKGYRYQQITELLGREHIGISTKSLLAQGLTIFNHYKAIGGTNWNAIGSIETYTSYDFGAPISEAGLNTERLFEAKAINYLLQSFDFTATDRVDAFPLALSHDDCLFAVRNLKAHPEARWLWLRNLTFDERTLTADAQYPIELRPFEVLMLPYRMPLACRGYELTFSTAEPLWQNETTLVLKAERSVTVTLQSDETTPIFADTTDDVALLSSVQGAVTFQCPELPDDAWRHVRFGRLNVLLLGRQLVDTFWVEDDGSMVAGADMRLPDGGYAVADGTRHVVSVSPDGADVTVRELSQWTSVSPPLLGPWEVADEALVLSGDSAGFQPVSAAGADFDANGLYEGSAWYRLSLKAGSKPAKIEIDARHLWAVFLNGQCIGEGQHLVLIHGMPAPAPAVLEIPDTAWRTDLPNDLFVFVDGLGHPKGFHDDAQTPQGLLTLAIDGVDCLKDVQIRVAFPHDDLFGMEDIASAAARRPAGEQNAAGSDFERSPVVRLKTSFSLPRTEAVVPWGLKFEAMDYERVNIVLNGVLIGRYWRDCQCQELFYLPDGILKSDLQAKNFLELLLMNFSPPIERKRLLVQSHPVTLHPYAILTRLPRD